MTREPRPDRTELAQLVDEFPPELETVLRLGGRKALDKSGARGRYVCPDCDGRGKLWSGRRVAAGAEPDRVRPTMMRIVEGDEFVPGTMHLTRCKRCRGYGIMTLGKDLPPLRRPRGRPKHAGD